MTPLVVTAAHAEHDVAAVTGVVVVVLVVVVALLLLLPLVKAFGEAAEDVYVYVAALLPVAA